MQQQQQHSSSKIDWYNAMMGEGSEMTSLLELGVSLMVEPTTRFETGMAVASLYGPTIVPFTPGTFDPVFKPVVVVTSAMSLFVTIHHFF